MPGAPSPRRTTDGRDGALPRAGRRSRGKCMKRVLSAFAGCAAVVAAVPGGATVAASAVTVHPFSAQAPDSAFHAKTKADTGVACTRPAPDGRVSTTIHCYTPDQIRSFYGLGPLASSNDGA